MRYLIFTFGCQANKADSERIETILKSKGWQRASSDKEADLIVINACSVRQSAIDRVYAKVNKFQNKKIILAGCLLEEDKKRLKEKVNEIWHPDEYFETKPNYNSSISAFIPIMTGCNNFCAYCVVPFTRGRERSRSAASILKEIKNLIKKGYKEIWLLGQNVNRYKDGKINFSQLIKSIDKIPAKFWLRFTSPHPADFSEELIKTLAQCKKFAHYLNLPVQSGSNAVLKKMNRNYTVGQYKRLVKRIKKEMPDISLSTDVIVGFPSETKKQFEETAKLFKELKFDMAFIAEYSPRPGTAAALTMKDNIKPCQKEKRRKKLTQILEKTALENNKKLLGKNVEVLVEAQKNNRIFGRTEGNKVVEIINIENKKPKIGDFVKVKIVKAEPWKLKGKIVKPKLIVILGPTASGKSDLSVYLAKKFNGEIISADSRQVYKGLDIGSGKITKKEMQGIKHYLLDVVSPKKIFTAADFKKLASQAIEEILKKGKIPIICGGTGFYISALLGDEIEIPKVEPDWNLRKKLAKKSAKELFKILQKLDSDRAKNIDPNNPRRLLRAIEIAKKLGRVPKQPRPDNFQAYDILWLGIKKTDNELRKRIRNRLLARLKKGMIAEVRKLRKRGLSWKRLDELGLEYRYISYYLQGKLSKDEMIEGLNKKINQYAKRQMTWFKKYMPETRWVKTPKEAERLTKNFLKIN